MDILLIFSSLQICIFLFAYIYYYFIYIQINIYLQNIHIKLSFTLEYGLCKLKDIINKI